MHDDNIQNELNSITEGQLEFNNKPFVKHRTDNQGDREDYRSSGTGNYRKNFVQRNNNGGGSGSRGSTNRGGTGGRDNRGGGGDSRSNNNNRNFKKRY